jgi:hypothetical protein
VGCRVAKMRDVDGARGGHVHVFAMAVRRASPVPKRKEPMDSVHLTAERGRDEVVPLG